MPASHAPRPPRKTGRGSRGALLVLLMALCLIPGSPLGADEAPRPTSALRSALPHVEPVMFTADFWIHKLADPDRPILDAAGIQAFNHRLRSDLPKCFFDLANLGPTVPGAFVRATIAAPEYPGVPIYVDGKVIDRAYVDAMFARMNLEDIQDTQPVRYGYTVKRANMRWFPSDAFSSTSPDDKIFDQLQTNAVNPAVPLAILHANRDGSWFYCATSNYSGWIASDAIALAPDRTSWLRYLQSPRFLVVTGSIIRLGQNPYSPEISELPFEMGATIPLVMDEHVPQVIDRQNITGNYLVRLPTRGTDGLVRFKLALVAPSLDVQDGYLPYTRGNILRQAFKSLGERYSWTGLGKDCSAYLQDIYRCFGLMLPRDSGQQAQVKASLDVAFDPLDLSYENRCALLRKLKPGAELFWGGHVLMYLGEHDNRHFVIHNAGDYGDENRPRATRIPWMAFEPIDLYQVTVMELTLQQSSNGKAYERLLCGKCYE